MRYDATGGNENLQITTNEMEMEMENVHKT